MKTRIIYTKFWKDSYIGDLSIEEKIVFLYLLTNENVGLSNLYECSDRNISFDTGISLQKLASIKEKFERDNRFLFEDGFVYIVNGEKYNQYRGEKNEKAREKEEELLGNDRISRFQDRVSIGYQYPSDTTINHKSEIINQKSEIINQKYIPNFEQFWKMYPRKVSKKKAESVYSKIATSEDKEISIIQGLQKYIEKWRLEKTNIEYIPHASTWLNGERWSDEVAVDREVFNANARRSEEEHQKRKEEERKRYEALKVDDGKGGMVSLKDILNSKK